MCRSQQVSEITEDCGKSERKRNLIENLGSCKKIDMMYVQTNIPVGRRTARYVTDRIMQKQQNGHRIQKKNEYKKEFSSEIQNPTE